MEPGEATTVRFLLACGKVILVSQAARQTKTGGGGQGRGVERVGGGRDEVGAGWGSDQAAGRAPGRGGDGVGAAAVDRPGPQLEADEAEERRGIAGRDGRGAGTVGTRHVAPGATEGGRALELDAGAAGPGDGDIAASGGDAADLDGRRGRADHASAGEGLGIETGDFNAGRVIAGYANVSVTFCGRSRCQLRMAATAPGQAGVASVRYVVAASTPTLASCSTALSTATTSTAPIILTLASGATAGSVRVYFCLDLSWTGTPPASWSPGVTFRLQQGQ